MELKIRKAKMNELPALMVLYEEARHFMKVHGNPTQWDNGYPQETLVREDIDNGILYVCIDADTAEERIAAVFTLCYGADVEPSYRIIVGGQWQNQLPYAVLHRVASAAWARGAGVVSHCLSWAFLQYGCLRIDTHADNIPMQKLLAKEGFQYCGKIYLEGDGGERIAFQKTASLILASASPRRRELMQKLGQPFVCEPALRAEHEPNTDCAPEDLAEQLAKKKANEILGQHMAEPVTVIGSDTVVICEGKLFGKPEDAEDAVRMLHALSGKTHEVRTGVAICTHEKALSFTSVTRVSFYALSDEEISVYVAGGEPMDKAGAYGIQGDGLFFVKEIEGDYNTVIGFPLAELKRALQGFAGN